MIFELPVEDSLKKASKHELKPLSTKISEISR